MKRWLQIGFLLLLFGIDLSVVYGQSVSIVCPKSVKVGNKFTCIVNASYEGEYGGIEGILGYTDGLTYNGFTRSYSNGEINNNKLSVYDVDLKKGTSKVGTISFTLKKSAKDSQLISLSQVIIFDADSVGMTVNDASSTVKIDVGNNKSSSAVSGNGGNASSGSGIGTTYSSKIKTLVISNGQLEFDKDVLEYEITVENSVTKLDIDIALEANSSKYTIEGNDDFQVGENLVEITVTSKKGETTIYKIKVKRLAKSNNSLLEKLEIADYKIDFNSKKFKYNLYIDSDTDSLAITALAKDEKSVVVVGGNEKLKTGSEVIIIVKAEDETTSMYQLKIIEKKVLLYLGIIGGIVLIALIGLVIVVMKKRKQHNQIFMDLKP